MFIKGKNLKGKTVAWVGDGNNVLHDLTAGSIKQGMNMHIATPIGYDPDPGVMERYPLYFVIALLEDD